MDYFLKRVIDSFTNLTETSEVMIEKPASIENLSAAATEKVTDTARYRLINIGCLKNHGKKSRKRPLPIGSTVI
jgi:hypothetical protein